ncbi:DUF2802 domain-containing protein [Vibrio profundum]|uniref:DUF2802 domain-containing protein n=1 Tax=Vibrio profundum TaxID=2910247 RepID=UPI003D132ECA
MNIELWMTPYFFIAGVGVVTLILIATLLSVRKKLFRLTDHHRQQYRLLEKEAKKSNKQLLEVRSIVVGLGQKVNEQQEILHHLSERIVELEQEDSDGRLYSRATKMARLGADVEELIEQCELPKAEAELMMSLQKKIAGEEKIPPLENSPEARTRSGRQSVGRK